MKVGFKYTKKKNTKILSVPTYCIYGILFIFKNY